MVRVRAGVGLDRYEALCRRACGRFAAVVGEAFISPVSPTCEAGLAHGVQVHVPMNKAAIITLSAFTSMAFACAERQQMDTATPETQYDIYEAEPEDLEDEADPAGVHDSSLGDDAVSDSARPSSDIPVSDEENNAGVRETGVEYNRNAPGVPSLAPRGSAAPKQRSMDENLQPTTPSEASYSSDERNYPE